MSGSRHFLFFLDALAIRERKNNEVHCNARALGWRRAMDASILRKLREQRSPAGFTATSRDIKLKQSAKLAELRQALMHAGFRSLDSQALALGLGRSTTWAILKAGHKSTGLTGSITGRILKSPELPPGARRVIEEYIAQKLAGAYGHDKRQRRKFRERLGLHVFPIILSQTYASAAEAIAPTEGNPAQNQ
jgi:hypothetical protein